MTKVRREASRSPMAGIFTRSRSEIFLHRTRSGRPRPDPTGSREVLHLPPSIPSDAVDPTVRPPIKDLRAHRVFSPKTPDQPDNLDPSADRMDLDDRSSEKPPSDLVAEPAAPDGSEVQTTPPDLDSTQNVTAAAISRLRPEPGSANPSKSRLGINPCSRSKLYRNPSSFGYRRLLPFLMDLEKNHSIGEEIPPCDDHHGKAQMNSEGSPLLPDADRPGSRRILNPTANTATEGHVSHLSKDVADDLIMMIETPVESDVKLDSAANTISQSHDICPRESLSVIETPSLLNKSPLHVQCVTSDAPLESSEFEMLQISSYCPPVSREALSFEEHAGNVQPPPPFLQKIEYGCKTQMPKPELDSKQPLELPKRLNRATSGNHALAPRKSILKKHTRGCKGLCMCLDCASFRLHAEKAYEFSRKQMVDVDAIMSGLINELSFARNIIENSVVTGDGNLKVRRLSKEQVKGVCQRAQRVEELAKSRMRHMIQELNVHCKVPGPRVTFAESLEESCKLLPK